jgi:hypothetical protein
MRYDNIRLDKDYHFMSNISCNLETYEIDIHFHPSKTEDSKFKSAIYGTVLGLFDYVIYGLVHETLHLVFQRHGLDSSLVDSDPILWVIQYVLGHKAYIQTKLKTCIKDKYIV